VIKSKYKVDLRALHALCEANYARLLRLFPDYESRNSSGFSVNEAQVRIEVIERSRYTTLFCLRSYRKAGSEASTQASTQDPSASDLAWFASMSIEVRAYHDAGMLEVVRFQSAGRTEGRYSYPNPSMHQQDEKNQQNRFLADWLSHCLHNGQAELGELLKPGAQHA